MGGRRVGSTGRSLIAIDPGASYFAWAWFGADGLLRKCGHDSTILKLDHLTGRADVAVERMRDRPRSPVRKNDILDVATTSGLVAGFLDPVDLRFVTPKEWKGDRPKRVDHPVTFDLLTAEERAAYSKGIRGLTKRQRLDVMDAIGIGMWALGRR